MESCKGGCEVQGVGFILGNIGDIGIMEKKKSKLLFICRSMDSFSMGPLSWDPCRI